MAFCFGIKYKDNGEKMNWIKFDKDDESTWPPKMKHIAIYDGKKIRIATFYYFEINGETLDTNFKIFRSHPQSIEKISIEIESKYITHWMSLPEPPKESE